MSMEQVTFDPSRKYSSCFQKFNILFQFSSLSSSSLKPNIRQDLDKKNSLKKCTVFKQKTKLIVKTISKHLQPFIYLFLFQQIPENGKKTKAGRERKKMIAQKLFHKRIATSVQLYFYISTLPLFKSFVQFLNKKSLWSIVFMMS